ncbi:MAG: hypothetical protein WBP93_12005 [Pyrinomonadaceae bacterium]
MRFLLALTLLLNSIPALAQHRHPARAQKKPVALMAGLGTHHHAVSTGNAQAQKFFDQGFTFIYAFNHEMAVRSFERAAQLDPQMAMAYWGVAYALGPNINMDVDPERERAAYAAAQKALALSKNAPENERAYIEALSKRYSNDPKADLKKLAVDFKNAMGELSRRFPDDLDAATLYAESGMNLRPWQLWTKDGQPAEGTEEIVSTLESVLRRDPNHIGAIHYYIHAVEASPNPERALAYVAKLPAQTPAAGHLVHMPAHIYMRTGDYANAALSNDLAAKADRAFFRLNGNEGMYPVMYYNHNVHFLAIAYSMEGRFADAIKAARELESNVSPHLKALPMLEGFMTTSTLMLVRFHRWDDILRLRKPAPNMAASNTLWHFARGMAFAAKGQTAQAVRELKLFIGARKGVPADANFGLNSAQNILQIAEDFLEGKIALAQKDYAAAVAHFESGVKIQDALAYDEPPAWFIPMREPFGGALMLQGKYAEAEKVFRADLEKNPHSGRSLFGLSESLKAQGKEEEAQTARKEFEAAWKNADTQLRINEL